MVPVVAGLATHNLVGSDHRRSTKAASAAIPRTAAALRYFCERVVWTALTAQLCRAATGTEKQTPGTEKQNPCAPAGEPDEVWVPGYPGVGRGQVAAVHLRHRLVQRPLRRPRLQRLLRRRAVPPRACEFGI